MALSFNCYSQRTCAADEYHMQQMQSNPQYRTNYKNIVKQRLVNQTQRIGCSGANTISVPLAFHFEAALNLSCADQACMLTEIMDQINALNIGYSDNTGATNLAGAPLLDVSGCAAYNGVISTGTCIDFCLATPPAGNADGLGAGDPPVTFGVYTASNASAPSWTGVINIFVGDCGGGVLGFSPLGGSANGDGICMAASSFGGPGGSAGCGLDNSGSFGLGATLVHEMGHYLGLEHTWAGAGGGCGDGDGIADTPNGDNNPFFGCPAGPGCATNSCGDIQAANFMDYTDDACMGIFTEGQAAIMNATALALFGAGNAACSATQAPASLAQCVVAACPVPTDITLDNLAEGDMFCTNDGAISLAALETAAAPYLPGFIISWTDGTWGGEFEAQVDDGCFGGGLLLPQGSFGTGNPSGAGSQDITYFSPEGITTITLTDANFADDSELLGLTIVDRLCGTVLFGPMDTGTGLTTAPLVVNIAANSLSGGVLLSGPGIVEDACSDAFAGFDPVVAGPGTHSICVDYAGVDCNTDGDFDDAGDCMAVQQCFSITVVDAPSFDLATFDVACSADGTTYDVSITLNYDPAATGSIALTATGGTLSPAVLSGTGTDILTVTGVTSGAAWDITVDDTSATDCDTQVGATFTCLDCSADMITELANGDQFCADDPIVPLTFPKIPAPVDVIITLNVVDGGDFPDEHVAAILPDLGGLPDYTNPLWQLNGGDATALSDLANATAANVLCDGAADIGGAGILSASGTMVTISAGSSYYIALADDWGDTWGATASFQFTDQCGNILADEALLANGCGTILGPLTTPSSSGTFSGLGASLIADPDGILGNGDESWAFDPSLAGATSCTAVTDDLVYLFQDECGNICDVRVTPTIYPAFDASLLTPTVGDCSTAPSLTSTCADYSIALDGDADDITGIPAAGTSGTNNYTITWTSGPACFSGSATVAYDCPTSCPDLTATVANTAVIVDSNCGAGCTVSGGSISAAATDNCPAMSTLQYGTSATGPWSAVIPAYGPGVTVYTSCVCTMDVSMFSTATSVTTAPGTCPVVADPTLTIVDNVCPATTGTISSNGLGGVITYYTGPDAATAAANAAADIGGSASAPAYGVSPTVVFVCITETDANGCVSNAVCGMTAPTSCGGPTFTYDGALSDPCDCNNDQSANGALDGTFSETVVYTTAPATPGLLLCASNSSTGVAAGSPFTDNGDGTYEISFTHTDGVGFSLSVADCADLTIDIAGPITNTCNYPIISMVVSDPCNTAGPIDLSTLAMETTGGAFAGTFSFSGTGVAGTLFDPSIAGIGTHTVTVDYAPTMVVGTNPGTITTCNTQIMVAINVVDCTCSGTNGSPMIKSIPGTNE